MPRYWPQVGTCAADSAWAAVPARCEPCVGINTIAGCGTTNSDGDTGTYPGNNRRGGRAKGELHC